MWENHLHKLKGIATIVIFYVIFILRVSVQVEHILNKDFNILTNSTKRTFNFKISQQKWPIIRVALNIISAK